MKRVVRVLELLQRVVVYYSAGYEALPREVRASYKAAKNAGFIDGITKYILYNNNLTIDDVEDVYWFHDENINLNIVIINDSEITVNNSVLDSPEVVLSINDRIDVLIPLSVLKVDDQNLVNNSIQYLDTVIGRIYRYYVNDDKEAIYSHTGKNISRIREILVSFTFFLNMFNCKGDDIGKAILAKYRSSIRNWDLIIIKSISDYVEDYKDEVDSIHQPYDLKAMIEELVSNFDIGDNEFWDYIIKSCKDYRSNNKVEQLWKLYETSLTNPGQIIKKKYVTVAKKDV